MKKNQKLELTWIGKDVRPQLEPRILLEDSAKSFHASSPCANMKCDTYPQAIRL